MVAAAETEDAATATARGTNVVRYLEATVPEDVIIMMLLRLARMLGGVRGGLDGGCVGCWRMLDWTLVNNRLDMLWLSSGRG